MKRQLVQFLFLLLVATFLFACGGDNSTLSTSNPFAGHWNIVFAGGQVGDGEIMIATNGEISGEARLQEYGRGPYKYPLQGKISNAGTLTDVKFLDWANDLEFGSVAGTLSGTLGGGTFQSQISTGSWTAKKIR